MMVGRVPQHVTALTEEYRREVVGMNGDAGAGPSEQVSQTPAFPVDALPESVGRYVKEAAAALSCPPDLVALPAIGALSGVIGLSRAVRIKTGWVESALLYLAVVGGAGEAKSPAQSAAVAPVEMLQGMLRTAYKEEKKIYEQEMREHVVAKKKAAKNEEPEPVPPAPPVMRRVIVDDITIEALASRLEENPRGLLSAQDELTGFIKGMDQYKSGGKGNARQSYIKIWSNRPITVDRKGAPEPQFIPKPFVTLQGGIQPAVLTEIGGGRDDGFLDRFLFAYPERGHGGWSDDEISSEAELEYNNIVTKLWNLNGVVSDNEDVMKPKVVPMSPEAKSLFKAEKNALAGERLEPGFPAVLDGPWKKMDTQLARLSLILATARNAKERTYKEEVNADDMRNALRLLEYFKASTRKVHRQLFGERPDDIIARDLVGFLRATDVLDVSDVFPHIKTYPTKAGYSSFKGTISSLMADMVEKEFGKHLPPNVRGMGRALDRIAKASPALHLYRYPRSTERRIALLLEKTSETSKTSVDGGEEVKL